MSDQQTPYWIENNKTPGVKRTREKGILWININRSINLKHLKGIHRICPTGFALGRGIQELCILRPENTVTGFSYNVQKVNAVLTKMSRNVVFICNGWTFRNKAQNSRSFQLKQEIISQQHKPIEPRMLWVKAWKNLVY